MSDSPQIRPIAICVFRRGTWILVGDGYDPAKEQVFYRPPGGGIAFGERSEEALRREVREELGAELTKPRLLGVIENLFAFNGQPGHEIVFVYDAEFVDESLYATAQFRGLESNGERFTALWLDLDTIGPQSPPVYPDGLLDLLHQAPSLG